VDFTGSDLADDPEQHKHLHICFLQGGLIGAFPNNRVLFRDDAFWKVMDQKPDFTSLAGEYRAEGHQHIMRECDQDLAPKLNGRGTPTERIDFSAGQGH
jgi:hypothetical protein